MLTSRGGKRTFGGICGAIDSLDKALAEEL